MKSLEKINKLQEVLTPLFEQCLTNQNESSILIRFKRGQVFEIMKEVKESSTKTDEATLIVFKQKKVTTT